MSALLGTDDKNPYVAITHLGAEYLFPLVKNPEELAGPGDIQTSTLESFSPSAVAGDPSLVSNELLATLIWSNWQRGMGTTRYREQEGTGSLDSFAYATLDTRFEGMAILPPRRKSLGSLPRARAGVDFLLTYDPAVDGLGTEIYRAIAWDTGTGAQAGLSMLRFNSFGVSPAWNDILLGGGATVVRQVVAYNGLYVAITDTAIYTSPGTVTWTPRWVSAGGFRGLAVHDNKLYTIAEADKKLYWTLDPTTASAWANSSTDPLRLDPNERVVKIVEWKNRQDTRSLFVLTEKRIVAFDDDNYWADFFGKDQVAGSGADLSVWPQDKALYYAPADNGSNLLQFQNQTIANIGPNKRGGLAKALGRVVGRLRGNLNFLFGQGRDTLPIVTLGIGYSGPGDIYGQIMAFNGQGWHTLVEGASGDTIDGMALARDQVLFCRNRQYVETIYVPDAPQPPTLINGPVEYATGTFFLESGSADAGMENIPKIARYWEIMVEGDDGTPGVPADHTVTFKVQYNPAAAWVTLLSGANWHSGATERVPAVAPPTITDDRGVPFGEIRWRIEITKGPGADVAVTPILRSVALYYLRAGDLIDGIQFQIDLSPNRIRELYGAQYSGKTPAMLRQVLQEIKTSRYNPRIEYGPPNNRVAIPAAELRIAQRESARSGVGQYIVTARNVSTPDQFYLPIV